MSVRPNAGALKPKRVQSFGTTPAVVSMIEGYANCLWVGATGSVVLKTDNGNVTFTGIAAGIWHPMPNFDEIVTITTATGVIAGQTY